MTTAAIRPVSFPVTSSTEPPSWLEAVHRTVPRPAFAAETADEQEEMVATTGDRAEAEPAKVDLEQLVALRVQEQLDRLRSEAEQAGREEGEAAGRQAYEQSAARLDVLIAALAEGIERHATQLEHQLLDLALAVAREVVGRDLREDRDYAVELAREALKLLGEADETEIAVAPIDGPVLTERIDQLSAAVPTAGRLKVRVDPAISAGCRVETRLATIDATVEGRLRNVRDAFQRGGGS